MLGLEGLEVMAGLEVMVLIFMSGGPPVGHSDCGLCGLCGPSDFEVLVYQRCLLVSVDECVWDGVGDNDDVCG